MSQTLEPWASLDDYLRRTLASARASKGYSWEDVATQLSKLGWEITAGNLMTRHSRGAFRADELLLLMRVLDVDTLTVPN